MQELASPRNINRPDPVTVPTIGYYAPSNPSIEMQHVTLILHLFTAWELGQKL